MSKKTASIILALLLLLFLAVAVVLNAVPLAGDLTGSYVEAISGTVLSTVVALVLVNVR